MMKRLPVILALVVLSISARAAITGSVVDEDGAPIAGAAVRAFAFEKPQAVAQRIQNGTLLRDPIARAETAADGTFRIDTGGAPVVILDASASGRQVTEVSVADGDETGPLMIAKASPRKIRITGDGKPLANAIFSINSTWAGKSGSDGVVEIPPMSGATHSYVVFHPDFAATSGNIDPRLNDVALSRGSVVKGRVFAADGKTVVPHARVSIGGWTSAETADDGTFTIAHAPSRWTTMRVSAGNTGASMASNSGAASYTIRLRPPVTINGTVRDVKSRAPVAGMTLWIGWRMEALPVETAITDAKGMFSFANVPASTYIINGRHPSYALTDPLSQQIAPDQHGPLSLAATPFARVRGVVVDEEKKPVRGATVSRGGGVFDAARGAVTNARGEFALRMQVAPMLAPETDIQATKEGYAASSATAKVVAGDTTSGVTITLARGIPITIRVMDRDQRPVEGAAVSLWRWRGEMYPQRQPLSVGEHRAAADGTVKLRVIAGKYDLNVSGDGVVQKLLPGQTLDEKSSPMNIVVDRGVEVSGRVVSADGVPIPEAIVQFQPANGAPLNMVADAAGTFAFRSAPAGPATLQATLSRASRIQSAKKEIKAPATGVVIAMPRDGAISGRVSDESTRSPITEFQVIVSRGGVGGNPITVQNDDGVFTISELAPGSTDVEVTARGYAPSSARGVEVQEGKTTSDVEVRLERGAIIKGHVTSSDGQPLDGVNVTVDGAPLFRGYVRNNTARDSTDMNGEYTLDGVVAGSRRVTFSKSGFVPQTKSVDAASGREMTLDATLDRGRELHGRVIDESGQGVASADMRADFESLPPTRTDPDGAFVMTGLRDQHYRLVARKNGYVEAHADDVDPNGPAVTLTLRRGGTITGHLSGLSDAELANAFVLVTGPGVTSNARVDASANFVVQGIPDGTFNIEASARTGGQMRRTPRKSVQVMSGSAPPVELSFAEGFTVGGRVTAHGQPLPDSSVTFSPADGATAMGGNFAHVESDGTYAATGITAGDYNVYVMAPPYGVVFSDRVTVGNSMTYDIDVRATTLRGRVVDAATNAPLPDAQIIFMQAADKVPVGVAPRPMSSDFDGRFSAGLVPERKWKLRVQREKYETAQLDVDVEPGMPDLEVRLSPATSLTVRVTDAQDGSAVVNAYVVATDAKNQAAFSAQTKEDGTVQLWLASGHYTVRASAQHFVFGTSGGDVPGPLVQITLDRAGRVVVASPAAAHVRLSAPGVAPMMSLTGRFDNVRPGNYAIELLSKDNKVLERKDIVVIASQTTTVAF